MVVPLKWQYFEAETFLIALIVHCDYGALAIADIRHSVSYAASLFRKYAYSIRDDHFSNATARISRLWTSRRTA